MFRIKFFFFFLVTTACGPKHYWQPVEGLGHPTGIEYRPQTCEQRLAQRMRIYADSGVNGNCRIEDRVWNPGIGSWVQMTSCEVRCYPQPFPSTGRVQTAPSISTSPTDAELRQRQADRVPTKEELENLWHFIERSREEERAREPVKVTEPVAEDRAPAPELPQQVRAPDMPVRTTTKTTGPSLAERVADKASSVASSVGGATSSGLTKVSEATASFLSVDCDYYRKEWSKIVREHGCGLENEPQPYCTLERLAWARYHKECGK